MYTIQPEQCIHSIIQCTCSANGNLPHKSVHVAYKYTSVHSLPCSAALPPVSPVSSQPVSDATASPSPKLMEIAPVNTSGKYQWECAPGCCVLIYR